MLFQFMEKQSTIPIGAIGTVLLDKNMQTIHSFSTFPSKRQIMNLMLRNYIKCIFPVYIRNYIKRIFPICTVNKERLPFNGKPFFEVDYITGADLFMSKQLFKQFNGFDPQFFMYYEETDLQKRMSYLALKRLIIDGPQIQHWGSASTSNSSYKRSMLEVVSMFKYFRKHSNRYIYYLFRIGYPIMGIPVLFDKRFTIDEKKKYLMFLFSGILR